MKCITVGWFCSKQKYIFEKVVQKKSKAVEIMMGKGGECTRWIMEKC